MRIKVPADSNAKGNAKIPAPMAELPKLKTAPQEFVLPAKKPSMIKIYVK